MSDLILAVPSKGRLQENAQAFFARAGLDLVQARGDRDYRGAVAGLPGVEVAYLSASEIARELLAGNVHLGITGADLVHEHVAEVDERLVFVMPLGFGRANVVVAVPQAWIDVATMADLDDVAAAFRQRHGRRLRVATKYVNLTRRFFAGHGIVDYRIVESLGATEGAPAAGVAEAVVDITTTGATLQANALKLLTDGTILESMANLIASPAALWSETSRGLLKTMLDRVAAEARARTIREVRFTEANPALAAEAAARFGAAEPFQPGSKGVLHVPAAKAFALVDHLRAQGAGTVTVAKLDYVFEETSALWTAVEGRLTGCL